MVGLVDIAPITSTVTVRGQDITVTGVSARGIAYLLAPRSIIHSWVEIRYEARWINLEGFILDTPYLASLQRRLKPQPTAAWRLDLDRRIVMSPTVQAMRIRLHQVAHLLAGALAPRLAVAPAAPLGLLDIGQGAVFYSTAKGRPALDFAPVGSPVSPFAAAVVAEPVIGKTP